MNGYIAYCGLDCEACEARLATVNNDNELRIKVAEEWSKLNGVEITPEMINCSGCRIPGVKTVYCDSLCLIRLCAREKQVETYTGIPICSVATFAAIQEGYFIRTGKGIKQKNIPTESGG